VAAEWIRVMPLSLFNGVAVGSSVAELFPGSCYHSIGFVTACPIRVCELQNETTGG
jgi:hypothetical protein